MFKDEKIEVFIGFNKITGAHLTQVSGTTEDKLATDYFKWKNVLINQNTHRWVGDYDDGRVMPIGELKPSTTETDADELCSKKIEKEVLPHQQMNVMADMFQALINKGVLDENDQGVADFQKQREYIDSCRKNNVLFKKAREESPEEHYKTKAQLDQKKSDQMAGGLNVLLGRH